MNTADNRGSVQGVYRLISGCVLLAILLVIIWYGISYLQQPVVDISWSNTLTEEQNSQISSIIDKSKVNGKLADVNGLKTVIEQLSWVQGIRIRRGVGRHWLDIDIFIPVARLNDRWFLSSDGKRKDIYDDSGYTDLIRYQFDPQHQKQLLPRIRGVQRQIQSLNLIVRELQVTPAGNWSVATDSGITIHFGAELISEKIDRLARLLPEIQRKGHPVRIDLRNNLGIAVRYDDTADLR